MIDFALRHGPPQRFRVPGKSAVEIATAMAGSSISESERVWMIGTILLEGLKRTLPPLERERLELAQRRAAQGAYVPEPPAEAEGR